MVQAIVKATPKTLDKPVVAVVKNGIARNGVAKAIAGKTVAAPVIQQAVQKPSVPGAKINGQTPAVVPVGSAVPAKSRAMSNARRNEQRTNQALSESRTELPGASKKNKALSARAAAAREADEQNQHLINNRPSAIPTDTKPRKNTAGLSNRELEFYRDLLLAKRRELVGDMSSMEREALRTTGGSNLSNLPIHMADMGTDNYEQEFTLGLMEKDRRLLRDINSALGKIQDGSYGICEGTGKPISKPRLEAQPWARYSIEHARKLERHMVR